MSVVSVYNAHTLMQYAYVKVETRNVAIKRKKTINNKTKQKKDERGEGTGKQDRARSVPANHVIKRTNETF